jgi:hypothetical protein
VGVWNPGVWGVWVSGILWNPLEPQRSEGMETCGRFGCGVGRPAHSPFQSKKPSGRLWEAFV